MASNYDALQKKARVLENEIDLKLVAFSKVGAGSLINGSPVDTAPLLGEHVFDTLSSEIEEMLHSLQTINDNMTEIPAVGTSMMHTQQRHLDILQGYKQEFSKIRTNYTTRIEREELLRGSGLHTSNNSNTTSSGLSRRDMYLKENAHLLTSNKLINDQISIAMETKEHMLSQRQTFKRLQTRFNDISNRFPMISSLLQRINIKKRRDSLILGAVIGICTIVLIMYALR